MGEIVNVYAEGEGFITYLLLKSLSGDGTLKVCFKFVDRLMFPPEKLNLMFIPEIQPSELEILKNHPHGERLTVISKNCRGLENCLPTPEGLPFFFGALKVAAEVLKDEKLSELLSKVEAFGVETEKVLPLAEKFKFYIPVLVGKRDSVIYGWKHFLGTAGVPSITHIYPRDAGVFLKLFENPLFADKIVPVALGVLPEGLLEEFKKRGFVPQRVEVEGKNNLDSEVKLIEYGRKVAEALKRVDF